MKNDFLRQLHVMAVLDRLFTVCTPMFVVLVVLAAIYAVI